MDLFADSVLTIEKTAPDRLAASTASLLRRTRYSRDYNASRHVVRYQPGDQVLLQLPPKLQTKLGPRWESPATVMEVLPRNTVRVRLVNGTTRTSHVQRMQLWIPALKWPRVSSFESTAVDLTAPSSCEASPSP